MTDRLETVKKLAYQAGQMALSMRPDIHPSIKSDGSFVTEADVAVENFLRESLKEAFPDYGFLGEEQENPVLERTSLDQPIWVVDPIDGTDAYRTGLAYFCVSIGLYERGCFTLGVIYLPVLNEVYSVDCNQAPTVNGRQIQVTGDSQFTDNSFLASSSNFHKKYRTSFPGKIRSLGSTAHHMCLVASGAAVGAVFNAFIWDVAAGVALVEAAGGKVGFVNGKSIDWTKHLNRDRLPHGLVVAPPQFYSAIRKTIKFRNK